MAIEIVIVNDLKGIRLNTDVDTDLSFSWENPFFFTGSIELRHSQELSVPATPFNCKSLDWSEKEAAVGMRTSKRCMLAYPGGEIVGKLYLKNHDGRRFNLLFVWGDELDDVFSANIGSFWQPNNRLIMSVDKDLPDTIKVEDFGFIYYHETAFGGDFSGGISLLPVMNYGWMMREAAAAALKKIYINGMALTDPSFTVADERNPYNYFLTLDRTNILQYYEFVFTNWKPTGQDALNFTVLDDQQATVPLASAGFAVDSKNFFTSTAGAYVNLYGFKATRPVRVMFAANPDIVLVVYSGTGANGVVSDYFVLNDSVELSMTAGNFWTLLNIADFDTYAQLPTFFGLAATEYIYYYRPDVRVDPGEAVSGSEIALADNLPELSLIDLIANYCLFTTSYYVIDGDDVKIYNTSEAIQEIREGLVPFVNLDNGKVVEVGELYRYIDGFGRNNRVDFDSADYVTEENRTLLSFSSNNDILNDDEQFGHLDFNGGNMNEDGTAVFQNFTTDENGAVVRNAKLSIMYVAEDVGNYSRHLKWVENNYGMSSELGRIVSNGMSERVSFVQPLADALKTTPNTLFHWRGVNWICKSLTWSGGITEILLVNIDNIIVN